MKALASLTGICALAAALSVLGAEAQVAPCETGNTLVSISGFAYSPASVTVAEGTTVCWTNQDASPHTVTSDTGAFDSGSLSLTQSFRHMFATAGTYGYNCAFHPGMNAEIVVTGASPPPPSPPSPQPHAHQTVSGFRVRVVRNGGRRWLVARARVTVAAQAQLRLLRGNRTVAGAKLRFRQGPNELRLPLRRSLPRGTYVARLTIGGAARPYTARIAIG